MLKLNIVYQDRKTKKLGKIENKYDLTNQKIEVDLRMAH